MTQRFVPDRRADGEGGRATDACRTVADRNPYHTSVAGGRRGPRNLYARISSADQQADLERQMARLAALWNQFSQEKFLGSLAG